MKRCWFGLGLLVVVLVLSILGSLFMTRIYENVEDDLNQAAQCALEGDWEAADRCFLRAKRTWKAWERLRASLADHTPVEEADANFAATQVYGYTRQDVSFAACCLQLARQVAAVGDAHEFVWWNIL